MWIKQEPGVNPGRARRCNSSSIVLNEDRGTFLTLCVTVLYIENGKAVKKEEKSENLPEKSVITLWLMGLTSNRFRNRKGKFWINYF